MAGAEGGQCQAAVPHWQSALHAAGRGDDEDSQQAPCCDLTLADEAVRGSGISLKVREHPEHMALKFASVELAHNFQALFDGATPPTAQAGHKILGAGAVGVRG